MALALAQASATAQESLACCKSLLKLVRLQPGVRVRARGARAQA
jgi:hypothetical protein